MALYFSLLLRGVPAELVHEVPARAPGGGRGDAQGHQVYTLRQLVFCQQSSVV